MLISLAFFIGALCGGFVVFAGAVLATDAENRGF